MSPGLWRRQTNPPNFFCRIHNKTWFNSRSQRRVACRGTPTPSLFANTAPLKCALPAKSSRKMFLVGRGAGILRVVVRTAAHAFPNGSSPAMYLATSSARLAPRPKECTLGVHTPPGITAGWHLPTGMLHRHHSCPTARGVASSQCRHRTAIPRIARIGR